METKLFYKTSKDYMIPHTAILFEKEQITCLSYMKQNSNYRGKVFSHKLECQSGALCPELECNFCLCIYGPLCHLLNICDRSYVPFIYNLLKKI